MADPAAWTDGIRRFTVSVFSTFAGNPYFIDLETLIEDELLTKEECDQADFGENEEEIDYGKNI